MNVLHLENMHYIIGIHKYWEFGINVFKHSCFACCIARFQNRLKIHLHTENIMTEFFILIERPFVYFLFK